MRRIKLIGGPLDGTLIVISDYHPYYEPLDLLLEATRHRYRLNVPCTVARFEQP